MTESPFIDSDICSQCNLSYGEHFTPERKWKYMHIFTLDKPKKEVKTYEINNIVITGDDAAEIVYDKLKEYNITQEIKDGVGIAFINQLNLALIFDGNTKNSKIKSIYSSKNKNNWMNSEKTDEWFYF